MRLPRIVPMIFRLVPPLRRGFARAAAPWWTAFALLAATSGSGAQDVSDAQLRARFLLNFMRFTEWPAAALPAADTPLEICMLASDDPFNGALALLQADKVSGRRIIVHNAVTADQAASCHMLYIPDAALRRLPAARETIGRRAVLIVGESEAVLDRGGMIGLRERERHLGFVVNLGSAHRAGLEFAPQMLHAATEVLP